ncbi:UDP-N-acetylglucosamine 2-epimerase (non-hydrolyzing) [Pedobacter sp. HMF7056]|uniref:UDP-N-acetylglucosamine 2-epimerase (non-hydrolyzing) n=1 Tax=Hufsiella ginkgonis TaxID=2695274 RepID=A0A7K1Y2B4_9SPHI|nr:UDP-N-acetylglucosamine 2-epimerase (non-hydrolyzing) [Hufsiella ginkgonis]
MKELKILIVFGTRPEAIKMAPLVKLFAADPRFETRVCVTAQHREMLDQVLRFFEITPAYDLDLMKPGQDLYHLTAAVITGMKPVLESFSPDYVFVHGDTSTSTGAALASFYAGARVCHVEAGLRTYNKRSPFPEEVNRQLTARIADLHFAPTNTAAANLLSEGISSQQICVTGNTVIDALLWARKKIAGYEDDEIRELKSLIQPGKKIVLVTGHRRENFGDGFLQICRAIRRIAEMENVQVIYPVHLNPNVQQPVRSLLTGIDTVTLISPLAYPAFIWLMEKSTLLLTDSGGVQEEAPSLGKPVLVMRNTTERPEAVHAGTVKLVGAHEDTIVSEASLLLTDPVAYARMSQNINPYGDGTACASIVRKILALNG